MWFLKRKKDVKQAPVVAPVDAVAELNKLADEKVRLEKIQADALKQKELEDKHLKLNELPEKALKDKEQVFIKTLTQVEILIEKCKIQGLTSPEKWKEAGLPMKDILQYLLKVSKDVSTERMTEASKITGVKNLI